MKTRKLSLLFLLFIMHAQPQKTAQAPVSTPTATTNTASADPAQDLLKKNQAQAAALVFPADMPTKSINEKNIDQIYGSAGIKITDNDLINIKKCYCYLEFLVKINKVKTDKAWAQYASDFKDFLQPTADNSPLKPTLTLVNSKGWQAIQITAQDITESPAWQFFSKAMICDTLYNDALFVVDVAQTNNQLFPYIPNIEASYSDNNFTKLRLYEESIQLQALMQSEQRNRYLAQCIDWKGISPDKISGVVDQFKKTDFYNYTHNSQAAQPTKNPTTGLTNPVIIPSPTREQIVCYFMLIHIQTTVHDIITQVNAQSILAQTSSSVLAPNFLFYGPSDFIYFNDIFTLGNLTDQNNTSPKNPMLPMQTATATTSTTPTAASNSVKIQAIPSGISAAQTTPLAPAPAPASSDPNDVATSIFKQLPTTSISETTLDQVYGPSGLNIAIDQLTNIKKTYCYLEYLIKVDKVRNDAKFAQYQQTDFKDYASAGSTTIHMPTQALVNSNAWKQIVITQDDIVASPAWQNFLKSMICDIVDNETAFIVDSTQINNQMFPYLANIETGYATNDFTSMRLYCESIQLHILMQADQKKRYLQQCIDWKNMDPTKMDATIAAFKKTDFYTNTHNAPNPLVKKTSVPFVVAEQIVGYFLLITIQNNVYEMMTLTNLPPFLNQASSSKIVPNFFTYTISDLIYLSDFLSLKKLLDQNKTAPQTSTVVMSQTTTTPASNVTVQSMQANEDDDDDIENNNELEEFDIPQDEVIIQKSILSKLKSVGKTISKGASDTLDPKKNGVADSVAATNKASADALDPAKNGLADSVAKTNKAAADALDPSKNGFNKLITDPAAAGFKTAIIDPTTKAIIDPAAAGFKKEVAPYLKVINKGINDGFKDMVTGIAVFSNDLATALIEVSSGIVYVGCSIGSVIPGVHVNPEKEAARCKANMNAHKSVIASVLGTVFIVVASFYLVVFTGGMAAPLLLGAFIGAAIVDKRVSQPLNAVGAAMMKGMMVVMMPIMQGMEAMTDAFTTGFIELSVGLTFCAFSLAHQINPKINVQQEMDKVRAKMEKYRSTINIVMSVFITVVMTVVIMVCTMGAGWALAGAIDAGLFGAEAAATAAEAAALALDAAATAADASAVTATAASASAATAAATAAGTQAAAEAAVLAAEEAAALAATQAAEMQAASLAAQVAVKQATTTAAQAAAKQAAELAAKQAAEAAAKQTATIAAKQAAETAAKDAAKIAAQKLAEKAAADAAEKLAVQTLKESTAMAEQAAAKALARKEAIDATAELATKQTEEAAAKLAVKQGVEGSAENLAKATAEREVAELAAKQAAEKSAQEATNLTALQAQQAADQAAAKAEADALTKQATYLERFSAYVSQATTSGSEVGAESAGNTGASTSTDSAVTTSTRTASQQAADKKAADLAVQASQLAAKQDAKIAAQQAEKQAIRDALATTANDTKSAAQAAETVAEKATSDLAAKQLEKQAAELALKEAQQTALEAQATAAKDSTNVFAQAAAKGAAKQVATKQAAADLADQAVVKASAQAAEKQALATTARTSADQAAAKLATQQAADETSTRLATQAAENLAAKQAESAGGKTAADLAAKKAAQQETQDLVAQQTEKENAAIAEAQIAKNAAAQDDAALQVAAKNLAAKQASKAEAQGLLDRAVAREAAANTQVESADANLLVAKQGVKDASANVIAKQSERNAAQIALKDAQATALEAQTTAAKDSTNVLAQAAAKGAAKQVAARQAAADAADQAVVKASAQVVAKQTTVRELDAVATQAYAEQSAAFSARQSSEATLSMFDNQATIAANEVAAKQVTATASKEVATTATEKQVATTVAKNSAQKIATNADQELLTTASKITAENNARIASMTLSQKAQQDGIWKALKDGTIYDVGFLIGQALNAGFGVFSAMAAVDQDEAAAEALEAERKSIQTLWGFVEDNKVNLIQNQQLYLDELHKKHQVAVENQAFGLQYYSNFLNSSVDNVQNQIAQALAQQYIQMLTPDANGLHTADIGATWGLQTQFDYLYPAQGFMTTTLGRPDFPYAQEVAQAPLASETHGDTSTDLSDNQPTATKLWFNQRAVSVINQAADKPLNVEIKFRVIYNLTTAYHVGLYLGGNYHDYNSAAYLQSIQDQGSIDLDEANLAKMFVLKRDDEKSAPSIGVYEHEGKGWITQQPVDANILNNASVYHMSANLNKDQLTLSFWPENNIAAKWSKTTTVTPCDQRTFGVIFSGVAIEWDMVQPTMSISQNKQARVASNGQSEADREKASKAQWKQLLNPKFGSMVLQSPGRPALLQGQYLYTTQSTALVDGQGAPMTDYVVFATSASSNVTNIGANPAPSDASQTPNAILSLITGNVYNSAGKIVTHKQNALATYAQNSSSISQSLGDAIAQAGQIYQQQLLNYSFGTYQLTALSTDAINAGLFIYTCPTTITTKDISGKPILDYLIMADIVNNSLGSTVGMPPSSTVLGMVSLVTGNVYGRTSTVPIDSGYSEITQYTKQYGKLPQAASAAITSAVNAYNNSLAAQAQAAQATKTPQVSVIASQTMSFTDLMNALPPSTGGFQFGLSTDAPSNIIATDASISQLQTSAAGSATISFGGMGAAGLDMGGFGDFSGPAFGADQGMSLGDTQTYSMPSYTAPATTANQQASANTSNQQTFDNNGTFSLGGFGMDDYSNDQVPIANPVSYPASAGSLNQQIPSSSQPTAANNTTYNASTQSGTVNINDYSFEQGSAGIGFGDDQGSSSNYINYTAPAITTNQQTSYATPVVNNVATVQQSTPASTAPATIDYSQFELAGSSGFSF